jgi:hypothetical protein
MTSGGRNHVFRWVNTYAYIGLLVLAMFWMMDGITVYRPPASAAMVAPSAPKPVKGRVFILLLDSLRYETAVNADWMPHLSALRKEAVWSEVKTSYNAVTVPCLRAAFTGRDEVSVLGFVDNFLHENAFIESLFSQMRDRGLRAAAFSDGSFRQFGDAISPSITTDLAIHDAGVENYDDQAVGRALALFEEKTHDMVIVHVRYTDYAAHEFGVGKPGYISRFSRADRLVAQAAAAIHSPDTLVVIGDHGHSPEGAHSLGQDVPTFALYRGPLFKAGYSLGKINITSHRWFLSEALGLQLPNDGYMGGRYPAALAGAPAVQPGGADIGVPVPRAVTPWMWVYLGLLAAFGAGLLWPEQAPWMKTTGAGAWVWLALPFAAAPLPWNAWLGAPVAAAVLGIMLRRRPWRDWLVAVACVGVACGWHAWGGMLATTRETLHALTRQQLACGWAVAGLVVVLFSTRRNRLWIVAGIVGAAGFLTLPTNYRYGFTGLMVPLLWLWLAGYLASLVREKRLGTWKAAGWAAGSALLIFAFTQAYAGTEARYHIFRDFVALVSFGPIDNEWILWRAVLAKIIIFFPVLPRRWMPAALKITLIAVLHQVQWRTRDPNAWESAAIILGLFGAWLAARRRDEETADALALGLLFFLFAYCVRPIRETYAYADCMLAGLLFAVRWLRRFPQKENAAGDYAVLGVVAFLATGFFSVSWSIEKLEWGRIYTWFSVGWIEQHAIVVVPWLVLKTALPLYIARVIMGRELRGLEIAWPGERLRRLVGFKLLTVILVLTGLGVSGTVSNVYLEGAQQLTVMLILWVAFAFQQKVRQPPNQPAEDEEQYAVAHVQKRDDRRLHGR